MNPLSDRIKKTMEDTGARTAVMICTIKSHYRILPPGAQVRRCSICNQEIIIAPSTASIDPPIKLICKDCAKLANIGHTSVMCVTREAIIEIAKRTGHAPSEKEIESVLRHARHVMDLPGSETKIV